MKLRLERTLGKLSTPGKLYLDDIFHCYTLEDVVREVEGKPVEEWKIKGDTAIPKGTYKIVIDFSVHFQRNLPHILDVPGFTGVRIHSGNTIKDTEGCILVGSGKVGDTITGSRNAFSALFTQLQFALVQGDSVSIEIT